MQQGLFRDALTGALRGESFQPRVEETHQQWMLTSVALDVGFINNVCYK